jgi:hypothetical protein
MYIIQFENKTKFDTKPSFKLSGFGVVMSIGWLSLPICVREAY